MPRTPSPSPRGHQAREISDAIVQLTRDATGRGPVRARIIIDGDAVVALLEDALTKAEQTLVGHGRSDEVLALRRALQDVMRPSYSAAVERVTGREVVTMMSTNHATPDRSAEIFLLDAGLGREGMAVVEG